MPISKSGIAAEGFFGAIDALESTLSETKQTDIETGRLTSLKDIEGVEKQSSSKYTGEFIEMFGKYAGYKQERAEAAEDIEYLEGISDEGITYERKIGDKDEGYDPSTIWGRYQKRADDWAVFMGFKEPIYTTSTGVDIPESMLKNVASIHRAMQAYPDLGPLAGYLALQKPDGKKLGEGSDAANILTGSTGQDDDDGEYSTDKEVEEWLDKQDDSEFLHGEGW